MWPQLSNYPGLTLKATITSIICAGWKEFGSNKTHCINAWDFPGWEKSINDDLEVCKAIYKALSTADAVVTHNGKRFDWKFLQTRLMHHNLPPLHKIHHIDTKEQAKRHLFAFNNRLGTVGQLLANDKKLENGGWDLWVKVSKRNKKAMRLMEKYCKQDVDLLEKVFKKLRPLINNIPNYNLFKMSHAGTKKMCPMCGSTRVRSNGWRHTSTQSYRRFKCLDCKGVHRVDKSGEKPRAL